MVTEAALFTARKRVEFADTDLAGIVHFANFFRYMENVEHAFYRSLGFSVHPSTAEGENPGVGWPRVSATCDYRKPLRFEEEISIELRIEEMRSKTIHYEFRFLKDDDDEPAAIGRMTVICVRFDDASGRMRAIDIPGDIREKITTLTHP